MILHKTRGTRVEGVLIMKHLFRCRLLQQLEHLALLTKPGFHGVEEFLREVFRHEESIPEGLTPKIQNRGQLMCLTRKVQWCDDKMK